MRPSPSAAPGTDRACRARRPGPPAAPAPARRASARAAAGRPSAARPARPGCRGTGPPASRPAGPARSAAPPRSAACRSSNGSESRSSSSRSSGRQAVLQLDDRPLVDLPQPLAAGLVERRRADLLEQLLDHAADPHDLRRLLDQAGRVLAVGVRRPSRPCRSAGRPGPTTTTVPAGGLTVVGGGWAVSGVWGASVMRSILRMREPVRQVLSVSPRERCADLNDATRSYD